MQVSDDMLCFQNSGIDKLETIPAKFRVEKKDRIGQALQARREHLCRREECRGEHWRGRKRERETLPGEEEQKHGTEEETLGSGNQEREVAVKDTGPGARSVEGRSALRRWSVILDRLMIRRRRFYF